MFTVVFFLTFYNHKAAGHFLEMSLSESFFEVKFRIKDVNLRLILDQNFTLASSIFPGGDDSGHIVFTVSPQVGYVVAPAVVGDYAVLAGVGNNQMVVNHAKPHRLVELIVDCAQKVTLT